MARSPVRRSKPAKRPKRAAGRKTAGRKSVARRSAAAKRPASKAPQRKKAAKRTARKAARTRKRPARAASAKRPVARAATKAARKPAKQTGMRVVLFGAGGMIGSRIAREALSRGHDVVAVQRNPGGLDLDGRHVMTVSGDATDPESVAQLARGTDAIVSAVSPRNPPGANTQARAARALLMGARKAGVKRLVVVGGAGSLLVGQNQMAIDQPGFPEAYKPEAREHVAALNVFRTEGQGVDWTFISPAAMISPGKRTGKYQVGRDNMLLGRDGQSQISAEDYAVALVDELERGENKGRRMAVAWP